MHATEVLPGLQTVAALEDGNLYTATLQDCAPIAEDAKARHKAGMHGSSELKHAARLPMSAVDTYLIVNGITLQEFLNNPVHCKRMLSDPALKDFRIWQGRV